MGQIATWTLIDFLEVIMGILTLVGLHSYVYKKVIFNRKFWNYFFWIQIVWTTIYIIYFLTPLQESIIIPQFLKGATSTDQGSFLTGVIISIPAYYALYQISQIKHKN